MEMEAEVLLVLKRYDSLERQTLLEIVLAGRYNNAAEKDFDAALLALKESGRALAPSGLHGHWMIAPPAPRPRIRRNEPASDSRRGGRRA